MEHRSEGEKPLTPADGRQFTRIAERGPVDYALRTLQQSLVHFSALADSKANIVISVSAFVFTIALTRLGEPSLRAPLVVLLAGTGCALVLAILCVLPGGYRPVTVERGNPLFFLHFGTVPVEAYLQEMDEVLSDLPRVYEAIVRDIHGQGAALARRKYRLLRWSYAALLGGFGASAVLAITTLASAPPA